MAQNPSNVIPDQLIVVEGGKQLVPPPSSGDSGKVLGVLNSNGDIGWTEDREGMAQQQSDWAETDSSKVTFIANKPNGQMAPTSTSSDSGKVLRVDAQGAPVWGDAPAGTAEFLWSTVTKADVEGAVAAGKSVVITDDTFSDNAVKCYLEDVQTSSLGTTYNFSSQTRPGSLDASAQNASVITLTISMNGAKFREHRAVGLKLVSEDSSVTIADGTIPGQLNITTNAVPASTSAEANKVLTVNSSGTPVWADAQGGGGGSGASGGTTIPADEPVKVRFTGTSTEGSFPGSVIMAGSDVLGDSPIVCIHVPKLALEYSSFSGGSFNTDYTLKLYDNDTYKADIATTKVYYADGKYRLVFPERWLYYNTLPALGTGHYYVLKVSYTAQGSSNTPSGSVEFFPYNANGKYLVPDLFVDQTSILSTRNVYRTPPGMQTVSVNLDPEKGIVDKTTHSYSDTTHTLSIDNTSVYRDGNGNSVSDFSDNTEHVKGAVALSNVPFYNATTYSYDYKFPAAHMISRRGGSNEGATDFQFNDFLDQKGPEFGTVYVVHIEGPATSTGSSDCPCICRFTLCESVEDWETMSQQQYYYYAVLPGVYVHSEQKVVADGVITISQTHPNGMFDSRFYTAPYIVSLDPNTTITETFGYVSDWNVCVSRI